LHARELEIYGQVLEHSKEPDAQLEALDTWSREFPKTPYADERTALYVQAYASVRPPQPAKVLDLGSQLMSRNLESLFPDPQRGPVLILSVLYSMSMSAWNLPQRTSAQNAAGLAAARELVHYAPTFFASSRRPSNLSTEAWAQARLAIETTAHQTEALLAGRANGPNHPGGRGQLH